MLNRIEIIGHLGRDPEVRYMPSGEAACNFAVATTEKWKDKNTGDMKEATEWHRVNFFGRMAEVCGEYLKKGSLVYVAGKSKSRKWTDKDGIEKTVTEISGQEMKMLGGRPEGGGQSKRTDDGYQQSPTPRSAPNFDGMDDDIPF